MSQASGPLADHGTGARRPRLSRALLSAWALLPALAAVPAFGQAPAPPIIQGPTIDSDRVDRQDPMIPRPAAPTQAPPAARAPIVATGTVASTIALKAVRFEGATLSAETLDSVAAQYIGQPLDRATLQKLANSISTAYAASDIAFFAVSIPAQTAAGGVLTVRVVEGRVGEYALSGTSPSMPTRLIDAHANRLMRDIPTHKGTMERTLSLLRDIPGQTVEARLRATAKPDVVALDLNVKRKQVEVTLDINNRGVVNVTSGLQAQVGVAVNGLLREGDTTRFSSYLPFQPSRYQFYAASHATPVGTNGTTFGISGAYVRTRTRDLGIRGEAKQLGIVVQHPLIRSYKRNLTLTASLDGTDSDNYYLDTAFGGFKTRALRLGANWSSVGDTGGYGVSTSISQGIDGLGAEAFEGYSEKTFRKANAQLTAVKQVGKAVTLKATLRGQYSGDRLPTTERFTLGGEGAGLAYRIGTVTADRAAVAGVEAAWRVAGASNASRGMTVFAYADGGVARSLARDRFLLPAQNFSLASLGGGVRIAPVKGWSANAQLAIPVKRPFERGDKKARLFFSLNRTI